MNGGSGREAALDRLLEAGDAARGDRRDERALIRAARRGSREAAEALAAKHWDGAYRAAYFIVRDPGIAEDVAQEALVAALGALGRFRVSRRFAPWLHRIAVNRAIDSLRVARRRGEVPLDARHEAALGPAVNEGLPAGLLAVLADLDAEDRAIVVLRHLFDYRASEIGRMLALPPSTVRTRLQRALVRLRDAIEEEAI